MKEYHCTKNYGKIVRCCGTQGILQKCLQLLKHDSTTSSHIAAAEEMNHENGSCSPLGWMLVPLAFG
jgi:hypothetical protein